MFRVADGDQRAFASLYQRTSARLLGVVLGIARTRGEAEEVLQEVFLSVWSRASTYDPSHGRPITWLMGIARNRAIDSLRRANARPQTISTAPDSGDGHDYWNAGAEGLGPMQSLASNQEAVLMKGCLAALEIPQRTSILLAFYEGLSHPEVAERMRQPIGTVKSWIRRSLMVLRQCIADAESGGRPFESRAARTTSKPPERA